MTRLLNAVEAAESSRRTYRDQLAARGTNCFRLFQPGADTDLPLAIDCYDRIALFLDYGDNQSTDWTDKLRSLAAQGVEREWWDTVYRKPFVRDRSHQAAGQEAYSAIPFFGKAVDSEVIVSEAGNRIKVRPYAGYSSGLFMDQRHNRERLLQLDGVGSVLNLFCYSAVFSIGFGRKGVPTTNVDLSAKYLAWGKENFLINGIDPTKHHWWRQDAREFLQKAAKKSQVWDLVVVDPPSFSRNDRGKVFSIEKEWPELLRSAIAVTSPRGHLFFSCNSAALGRNLLLSRASSIGAELGRFQDWEWCVLPPDYSGGDHTLHAMLGSS